MSIQSDIQANIDRYPPSMRRIAEAVLARPDDLAGTTISELARACDTSETTVVRFARTLGFTGFGPLRLRLVAELATESVQFGPESAYGSDIGPGDSLADTIGKISVSEVLGIQETAASLDLGALQRAIDAIASSRRAMLFGVAASGIPARDLGEKLLRMGRVATPVVDAHDAISSAALLEDSDVAIAFSHSGRTTEIVSFLRVARAAGATTIVVCNAIDSPAAREAEIVLGTSVRETTFRSGAMASRVAQMTIVDYLFVGVARADVEATASAFRRTREVLKGMRDDR